MIECVGIIWNLTSNINKKIVYHISEKNIYKPKFKYFGLKYCIRFIYRELIFIQLFNVQHVNYNLLQLFNGQYIDYSF